jgi:hypothetical protein
LNAGALFYKFFFFFNFPGALSDGLPRFKAGPTMHSREEIPIHGRNFSNRKPFMAMKDLDQHNNNQQSSTHSHKPNKPNHNFPIEPINFLPFSYLPNNKRKNRKRKDQ